MANREDAGVQGEKPTDAHAVLNLMAGYPKPENLVPRNDPVLPSREIPDHPVRWG
jgi:hypothetical protein